MIYLIAAGCYYLVKAVYKDTQVRSLERQLNAQADHYTRLQRSQEELRVFRHNVKNDLLCLDTLLARGEVDEAAEFLRQIDAQAQAWAGKVLNTGNPVMDAIVMEKEAAALKQGVRFEKEISVLPNLPIRPISWVALLGNALDNALEACAKLKEPQRFIRLTLRGHGNYLSIDIQNPCAGNARYPFRTSKKDAQHHGLGIASMRSAAARYGGDISIGCKDHLFSVHVDFWNLSPERTKREAVHSSSEETP